MSSLPPPCFRYEKTKEGLHFYCSGTWRSQFLHHIEAQWPQIKKALSSHPSPKMHLHIASESSWDLSGAWILEKLDQLVTRKGLSWQLHDSDNKVTPLLKKVQSLSPHRLSPSKKDIALEETNGFGLKDLGAFFDTFYHAGRDILGFLGNIVVVGWVTLVKRKKIRLTSVIYHIEKTGLRAIPIVSLTSFLIGMVLAYQGINQLAPFGAELFTVNFLGISIFRELGVLLTAVVVAGRSGSAFAAQIGTMKLNQEVEAIKTFQLDPVNVLVLPRLIALVFSLPFLAFIANIAALAGGMVMLLFVLDLSPFQYIHQLHQGVALKHFVVGMVKSPIFALLIAVASCFRGMNVKESAESLGRMTTQAVVESLFLVIVCDAFFSILFSYLKI